MSSTAHVLMCEPRHYRIAYEINPWMHRTNAVVEHLARAQWRDLHRALLDLDVRVELVEQRQDVPDMVFTANAGILSGTRFVPANFRFAERQPESPVFTRWFADRGTEIIAIDPAHHWEGEGDVLEVDGRVFTASGTRTESSALDALDSILAVQTIRLELVDPRFYHLDTCFFPIDAHRAMFVPGAFSEVSRSRLEASFDDLIEVPLEDGLRFACNALRVRDTVVLNSGCGRTVAALERRGFRCVETPMGEFLKAGGSVKCLVLTLDHFAP